jgi:uncharacterized protein YprB with RNaseH-like and TPR domain
MPKACVIDIETDGLSPTVIHCLVALDVDHGIVQTFLNPTGLSGYLETFDRVVAHNGSAFDFPALKKLWNTAVPTDKQWEERGEIVWGLLRETLTDPGTRSVTR